MTRMNAIRFALDIGEIAERTEHAPPPTGAFKRALAALAEVEAEIADLRASVVAFGAPSVVQWARDMGLPDKHLHPEHYDLLARCGARMDDFTRGDVP
jgi:hypothetical protein